MRVDTSLDQSIASHHVHRPVAGVETGLQEKERQEDDCLCGAADHDCGALQGQAGASPSSHLHQNGLNSAGTSALGSEAHERVRKVRCTPDLCHALIIENLVEHGGPWISDTAKAGTAK